MANAVLTINAGSSSIKFALFELGAELTRVAEGLAEGIGATPHLLHQGGRQGGAGKTLAGTRARDP